MVKIPEARDSRHNAKWETFLGNMFISNPVGWLLDDVFSVLQPGP
jgi:hypothetical protein